MPLLEHGKSPVSGTPFGFPVFSAVPLPFTAQDGVPKAGSAGAELLHIRMQCPLVINIQKPTPNYFSKTWRKEPFSVLILRPKAVSGTLRYLPLSAKSH